ncbi:MAG: hypothetical protein HWD59_05460 [Coxiellaceae bacterium]|nr:MAG: hypothetical protein HWD59_05460 [Coxiellaceae bacterium]
MLRWPQLNWFSHPYFRGRRAEQWGYVVIGLLVLLIIFQVLSLVKVLSPETPIAPLIAKPTTPLNIAPIQPIPTLHLFGVTSNEIPLSSLNLKITGIFYAPDDQHSYVVIEGPGEPLSKLYRPGESLPGGILLVKVLPDSVLIKRNGQVEKC